MTELSDGTEVAWDNRRYTILAIYDISNTKRRNQMVKWLESYGIRVQKSAFEARLKKSEFDAMIQGASGLIDPEVDSLRIYLLPKETYVKTWGVGEKHTEDIIIL